jgi:hypothetical protein
MLVKVFAPPQSMAESNEQPKNPNTEELEQLNRLLENTEISKYN